MVQEAMGDLPQVTSLWFVMLINFAVATILKGGNLQALNSYEEAAKLQSGSDLSQKITSLKKAIRKGSSKVTPKAADKGSGSSFAFAGSNGTGAAPEQQKSRIAKAPTVGAVKDDKDYEQAKKSMVSLLIQAVKCTSRLPRDCLLLTQ